MYPERVSLEGSGPGGLKSRWDRRQAKILCVSQTAEMILDQVVVVFTLKRSFFLPDDRSSTPSVRPDS